MSRHSDQQPALGGRIPYVDGIRGYLIYAMTLSHLGVVLGPNLLTGVTHKTFFVFFSGEGFMMISGLMIGYIIFGPFVADGLFAALRISLKRSWKIIFHYLIIYMLCVVPLIANQLYSDPMMNNFFRGRDPSSSSSFLMFTVGLYRPLMFDILYLYIILIAVSPFLLFAAVRIGSQYVVGASVAFWLSVQYGLVDKLSSKLETLLGADVGTLFNASFPILAWQLPFVGGLLLGVRVASDRRVILRILDLLRKHALPYAISICCAFAFFRLMTEVGIVRLNGDFFRQYLSLGALTLLNFFAFCLVVACVLRASTDDPNALMRLSRRVLIAIVNNRILRSIGSNTLLTFSGSIVLTYWLIGARGILMDIGPPLVVNTLVLIAVLFALHGLVIFARRVRIGRAAVQA
jgi:hypothetical protein